MNSKRRNVANIRTAAEPEAIYKPEPRYRDDGASVTTLTIKPGRYEDFLASIQKSKSLLEKHGAKNVRLIVSMSGQTSGSFALTHEADDYTDAGRITDKFLADPEGLAVTMESGTAEGPVVSWQPSTWMEIPL